MYTEDKSSYSGAVTWSETEDEEDDEPQPRDTPGSVESPGSVVNAVPSHHMLPKDTRDSVESTPDHEKASSEKAEGLSDTLGSKAGSEIPEEGWLTREGDWQNESGDDDEYDHDNDYDYEYDSDNEYEHDFDADGDGHGDRDSNRASNASGARATDATAVGGAMVSIDRNIGRDVNGTNYESVVPPTVDASGSWSDMAVVLERQGRELEDIAASARSQCVRAMGQQAFTELYHQLHANSRGNPLSSLSGPAIEALQRRIIASLLDEQQRQQQQEEDNVAGDEQAGTVASVTSGGAQQVMFHIRNLMAAEEGLKEVKADLQASRGARSAASSGGGGVVEGSGPSVVTHGSDADVAEDSDYEEDSFNLDDSGSFCGGDADVVLQGSLALERRAGGR